MFTESRADEIRAAILADPDRPDRDIARELKIRAWSRVRDVRKALLAEAPPAPPPPVEAAPELIICAACGREGTPSRRDPALCVGCGISPETAEVRKQMLPPLSSGSTRLLSLLSTRPDDTMLTNALRVGYLRHRWLDFTILEVR